MAYFLLIGLKYTLYVTCCMSIFCWLIVINLPQTAFLVGAIIFSVYWVITIFIFLGKRALYANYTTSTQRFWKRAFSLFWAIEFFLFFIFIYLLLIAPRESEWLLDYSQLFLGTSVAQEHLFISLLMCLWLIYVVDILGYSYITGNYLLRYALLLFCSICIYGFVWGEFWLTYYFSIMHISGRWGYNLEAHLWGWQGDNLRLRTKHQYVYLIALLKFWHLLIIMAIWLVSIVRVIQVYNYGQGLFALNKQNLLYMYGFILLTFLVFFSKYLSYVYSAVYMWFFSEMVITGEGVWPLIFSICGGLLY